MHLDRYIRDQAVGPRENFAFFTLHETLKATAEIASRLLTIDAALLPYWMRSTAMETIIAVSAIYSHVKADLQLLKQMLVEPLTERGDLHSRVKLIHAVLKEDTIWRSARKEIIESIMQTALMLDSSLHLDRTTRAQCIKFTNQLRALLLTKA